MNGDGTMDLMTGCFEGGVYLLIGLGEGRFAEPRPILDQEGARVRLGRYWDDQERKWTEVKTSLFANEQGISATPVDWDDDGDQDLLLGARSGAVFLRLNEGSATEPAFAVHSEQVRANGGNLQVPGKSAMVTTADWDHDGLWDLVAGSATGAVYWFRNVGKRGAPEFAAEACLVKAGVDRPPTTEVPGPGTRVQVSAVDHNSDGLLDLLLGDHQYLPVEAPKLTPEELDRAKALHDERDQILKKLSELRAKRSRDTASEGREKKEDPEYEEVMARYREIYQELSVLEPGPALHGWVWLFERKATAGR